MTFVAGLRSDGGHQKLLTEMKLNFAQAIKLVYGTGRSDRSIIQNSPNKHPLSPSSDKQHNHTKTLLEHEIVLQMWNDKPQIG